MRLAAAVGTKILSTLSELPPASLESHHPCVWLPVYAAWCREACTPSAPVSRRGSLPFVIFFKRSPPAPARVEILSAPAFPTIAPHQPPCPPRPPTTATLPPFST